jgi:hypothetical protein
MAYLVFNKAAAAQAERTFNQKCNVSTLTASSLVTLAKRRNARSKIFDEHGNDSYQPLLRRIAQSMCEKEEYGMYFRLLEPTEVAWLVDKFALVLPALLDDFMQSYNTVKEYWFDGNPLCNFVKPQQAYSDLHESLFAEQHPWLRCLASSNGADQLGYFYSRAMTGVWTRITRAGEYTLFDAVTKQVQLEQLWPVVSRSALVKFIFVDEAQDLTQAQLQYLARLAKMGMIVIFVGDAMQGIYRFRGAVGAAPRPGH